jgi:phage terminase large subunit-like protein
MTPTIIEALDDPGLFAPHFRGDTWRPWRAFLAALFGLPLSDDQLALYRAHTGRTAAPAAPFAEATLLIGRRGGKSRVLALVATYLATFIDYEPFLAPGEVAALAVIAADRKQARAIFRFTIGLLRAVPMLDAMIEDATSETIVLTNRAVIEIHTASFRVTRGYTFAAVLADETAFWRDENSANRTVRFSVLCARGCRRFPAPCC